MSYIRIVHCEVAVCHMHHESLNEGEERRRSSALCGIEREERMGDSSFYLRVERVWRPQRHCGERKGEGTSLGGGVALNLETNHK